MAVGLAACGSSSSPPPRASSTQASSRQAAAPAASGQVKISGYAFHPVTSTVGPGARVTFTNHDQTAHTATSSKSGVFDTGTLKPGESRTVVLRKPGTYTYFCQFHAFMRATIVVR
jgi:plastocyanin